MDCFDVFTSPIRPKLKFGEPLSEVCKNGVFHAALKDLFLKAYLSARGDDEDIDTLDGITAESPPVIRALSSGERGQGTLAQRMSLKSKLESGEWLVPAQTAPGAGLWLLRHFLGRLPQPLLKGLPWKILGGAACGAGTPQQVAKLLGRIAILTRALNPLELELLALLTLLIRKLSGDKRPEVEELLREEALNGLSQYFIASIIARPFRPGLYTKADKQCQPLLVFIARYWHDVFKENDGISNFSDRLMQSGGKFFESTPKEQLKCFRNDLRIISDERCRLIGFEMVERECDSTGGSERVRESMEDCQMTQKALDFETECCSEELEDETNEGDSDEIDDMEDHSRGVTCASQEIEKVSDGLNMKLSKSWIRLYGNTKSISLSEPKSVVDKGKMNNSKILVKFRTAENEFFSFPSSQVSDRSAN